MSNLALHSYALLLSSWQPPSSRPLLWQALSGEFTFCITGQPIPRCNTVGGGEAVFMCPRKDWSGEFVDVYHYTLRGYNTAGWIVLTLEMQVCNWGKVFTYGSSSWKAWASKATGGNLLARHFFNIGDHKEVI
ncbi:hypothetical protein EDD18DRAFT_1343219 [Armillaria luteobubalina]|uniref:Uncharacterized protein n=1 Tax=Armillaria luteobubalina TaxID=153913 RepID=A0AA39QS95_9AGAR|nr:hypothetical protein EDD18DRAFT_1343219 [Armillaria luteobubalina]